MYYEWISLDGFVNVRQFALKPNQRRSFACGTLKFFLNGSERFKLNIFAHVHPSGTLRSPISFLFFRLSEKACAIIKSNISVKFFPAFKKRTQEYIIAIHFQELYLTITLDNDVHLCHVLLFITK